MPQPAFTREHKGTDLHEGTQEAKALAYVAVVWQAHGACLLGFAQARQNSIAKMAHLAGQEGTSSFHKYLDQGLQAHVHFHNIAHVIR